MKIWNTVKLDSILERCDVPAPTTTKHPPGGQPTSMVATNQRNLTRLLASERLHGTTERDPTQKRHDFRYFSKASYFVLVEDVKQELATVHAFEYPIHKGRDGKERGAWPVLYCHPHSRGPFIEFDEKERRRWEKAKRAEEIKETERQQQAARELRRKKQAQAQLLARKTGDLRRSVSMNNLHRQVANAGVEDIDLDVDFPDTQASVNASGYLASTSNYIAASGNSVGITSTTGTTSVGGAGLRALELPANLRGRIQQQVVTSRRVSTLAIGKDSSNRQLGAMGPPESIPDRRNAILRKSRSTNTLRLPKRDEGCKPGYCECCRVKFEDFEYVSLSFARLCLRSTFGSTFETGSTASLPRMTRITFNWTLFSTVFNAALDNSTRSKNTRRRILKIIPCVPHHHYLEEMTKTTCGIVTWTLMETLFPRSEEAFQPLYGVQLVGLFHPPAVA